MMIRLTVGIVLALHVTLAVASDTGTLRLAVRDIDGPFPGIVVDLQCPNDSFRRRKTLTGVDGSVVLHEVPATPRDDTGCTLVVEMPIFYEVHVAGITIQPGRERFIPIFMTPRSTPRLRVTFDTVIACPSLDDLLTAMFKAKIYDTCERLDFDPSVLPVLERGKPIYDGKEVTVRRVRAPNGRVVWVMDFWENVPPPREFRFYHAYYARTRVPVQLNPERDSTIILFFERGETILVRTDPPGPTKTGRVPVMIKHEVSGWVDANKLRR